MAYARTAHRRGSGCQCGEKVVLPLHPTAWRLRFNGNTITRWPSLGYRDFPCRSHDLMADYRVE
ncbi:DUF6527 family protein [Dinoroseobacter sp. S76]|uniref:DUF6527 family protein n=1 Tax=Dinoroseobacter sp. S76 TaxID=3415124 RepID=UPI003C7B5441